MKPEMVFDSLERNEAVFKALLDKQPEELQTWRSAPDKWCLLEIVCHLFDEEREDFRARLRHVLAAPDQPLPPSDPVGWIKERNYMGQDYEQKLQDFLEQRRQSVAWLRSLQNPAWGNAFQHKTHGPLRAQMFLENWLEHDYLHIRQILNLKHEYLAQSTDEVLLYAGEW